MITDPFRPNKLEANDIPKLEPWQLLVAACHFAPRMGDCVMHDYAYRLDGDTVTLVADERGRDISLSDDIDLGSPDLTLAKYSHLTWKDHAAAYLHGRLAEEEADEQ